MTEKKKKKKHWFTAEPAENTESRKKHLSRLSALRARGGKQIQNFLRDEKAVSEVIGFVLIMGIVLSASSIYFATQIPELTADYESLHTADVADDLSELKTVIDGIVLKKGESELAGGAIPVKMAPDKVPILGMSPSGSNLIVNPEAEKFELVVPADGGGGGGGTQTWVQNTTSNFSAAIKLINVDTYSDEVKLSKLTPEGDLNLDNDTTVLEGEHDYDQVVIKNYSTLYVSPATGTLKIYANNITIDSGSKIIADYVGFSGGDGGKGANESGEDGLGLGAGKGGAAGKKGKGGGGAGYGGSGGDGAGIGGGAGGNYYGDETSSSIEMGSGGGGGGAGDKGVDGGNGGNGGGAILLDAEQINITGTVSADGEKGVNGDHPKGGGGGGGSGGGILIRGKDVTISGMLSAKGGNGGDGGDEGGGGGAGGRIKIFYESGSVSINNGTADPGGDAVGKVGGAGGEAGVYKYPGEYYTSSITHHSSGYLISEVYNTTSDSVCYGEMTWNATLNDQTLVMKVRTDMFENMKASPDWDYCPSVSNGSDISDLSSVSDGHRFIQYRAELSTDDTATTPVLREVKINYSFSAQGPTLANSSGSIKFNSNYLHYPNQEIVYEHGAVIKYQREGGFMLQEPPIIITNEGGIPVIKISMVNLTGANYSYSGSTSTSVKNSYKSYELLADCLKYPNLTINITTDYPSVWGDWFNKTFEETTLTTPHHYTVSVDATAKTVSVEFYGHEQGVELYLEKTAVEVEI